MWIRYVLLALIGLCAGGVIAAGFFAFLTAIGIVTTYAYRTHTAKKIKLYETTIMIGGITGNIWWMLGKPVDFGKMAPFFLAFIGFFYGIFTGSLILGLAETIKAIPIFFRRARIDIGLPLIVAAFAIGKAVGALLYYYFGLTVS